MDWNTFYNKRVNSTYQLYFEKRYKVFLEAIVKAQPTIIIEAGCGIASISKYFTRFGISCEGFDNNLDMVKLSRVNCPEGQFHEGNIFDYKSEHLVITHGVLEHFDNNQIRTILKQLPNSIHYVPLAKYSKPSYGDERLMSESFWTSNFEIKETKVFNGGYDLHFKSNY